jgi:hypothetical protein
MKIRKNRARGKRWSKTNLRRKIRRIENRNYDVKRDTMIGAACRRGWGAGYATI